MNLFCYVAIAISAICFSGACGARTAAPEDEHNRVPNIVLSISGGVFVIACLTRATIYFLS
jgi:hypothetical protein